MAKQKPHNRSSGTEKQPKKQNSCPYSIWVQRGGVIVEFVILIPVLVVSIIWLAHITSMRSLDSMVLTSAQEIARSSAMESREIRAQDKAQDLAATLRQDPQLEKCGNFSVTLNTETWYDGWITSTVRCETPGHILFGARTIEYDWVEPIFITGLLAD